jgi:hypothetical protein
VPFLIALILYKKFYKNSGVSFEFFFLQFTSLPWYWYLVLIGFSLLNWGLEIRKWQYLICKLELQPFKVAGKSVLSGMAVSQLLPFRTGEFLGRLAYVGDENKINAGILSIAGSFTQLLVTLFFGAFAFFYLQPIEIPLFFILSLSAFVLLLILGYLYMPQFIPIKNSVFFTAIREALGFLKRNDRLRLIGFSSLRYVLFVLPYALMAQYFHVGASSNVFFLMGSVSCIFFLQTVSPSFILTDLAIRISVPALVFSGSFDANNNFDFMPGMVIYVFNILIPMLMGAIILLSLKLKK